MANILGINLSELGAAAIREKIAGFLAGQTQHYLVTPNPEIILAAQKDEELFYILNKASLAPADGFGLKVAGFLNGENLPRVTGADLTLDLLELAARQGFKTMVLNWRGGLSSRGDLTAALEKKFSSLNFKVIDIDRAILLAPAMIKKINDYAPSLLFNTLGAPYQEKLIYHNLKSLPSVRVALGVGGAFDFISGRAQRAPRIIRRLGLEWLWRLIRRPQRGKRIYNATCVFLQKIFINKYLNYWRYRSNVACILYKNNGSRKDILILRREDSGQHWQLPQGGTDGEDIVTAGRRELREETSVKDEDIITRGSFPNIYRYKFGRAAGKAAYQTADNQKPLQKPKYAGYKGQKQSLYVAEYRGSDEAIKLNFWDHTDWKWVPADRLIEEVHPVRQTGAKIFLAKFKSLNL